MDETTVLGEVRRLAAEFGRERAERQLRRRLEPRDFEALRRAGLPLLAVPETEGGLWRSVSGSARGICDAYHALAGGDASLALAASMHPAVLSYWLAAPEAADSDRWRSQCREIFQGVREGSWWGTITSEPGSGGDIRRTRAVAARGASAHEYLLSGEKHFGSGSGMHSFMVTAAVPEGETEPDWFYLDMRGVPWDGSRGIRLLAEWDGHGMAATQSHSMSFDRFPATRIAWPGHLEEISARSGAFIACLFTSVIAGIAAAALEAARERITPGALSAFQRIEWSRAGIEGWLIEQAREGMLRALESKTDARREALQGKIAVAELAESALGRISRAIGGGTYSRRSPFGFWFEDVRALGFLRPPWGLAFDRLHALLAEED